MTAARDISARPNEAADSPVAGTIRPAGPDDLDQAVESWLSHLTATGRTYNTIRQYRAMMMRARRETGWSRLSQITYTEIMHYLDSRRAGWRAETYNCNLTAWRSFARHLCRTDHAWVRVVGQMDATEQCQGQPSDGSRASTTEEARAIIAVAARGVLDGRSQSPRDLVYKVLFLAGLRGTEAEGLLWRHVLLDDDVPHIWWGGRLGAPHKAKRQQRVAILPELATLLSVHRPAGFSPDDRVFPMLPGRTTWERDREIADITKIDDRGRTYSRHSARKWLATTLASHGVDGKYVDWFMRHKGKVEARYFDPQLNEQAGVLRSIPVFFSDILDSSPLLADTEGGTSEHASGQPPQLTTSTCPSACPVRDVPTDAQSVTADGHALEAGSDGVAEWFQGIQVREKCDTITPIIDLIIRSNPSREEMARALESLAALIRHQ